MTVRTDLRVYKEKVIMDCREVAESQKVRRDFCVVTVKEIAKICGVSASTVSNVLNNKPNVGEESRRRVWEVVNRTGYHPNYLAASIRRQNSRLIGVIVEDLCQFTTPLIVEMIMKQCEVRGYRTILLNLRLYDRWQDTWYQDEEKLESVVVPALQELESIKVDGAIYVAGHGRVIRCFPKSYTIPTVIAYAESENGRFPSILIDDEAGGYEMGKYLIAMGHKKIGVLAGVASNMHSRLRLEGFQRALFEANIPYNPRWLLHGTWQRESGYGNAEALLATGVSAIWCMNDQMAGGVYDYFYEHGIAVGRDVSVAGYDNMSESSYLHPRLTTNELPLSEIGRQAAERVIGMVEREAEGMGQENGAEGKDDTHMHKVGIGGVAGYSKTWVPCTMVFGDSVWPKEG